jgi:alkanesulfonate monooxygenase SsuD/methylene tetrahydromethanopterin reductase-like flavin-dependent oxidoreductase (luciferase family)
MRLGLVHINMGPMSQPDALVAAARAAEAAGFDSVWAGEHIVLPDPQAPPSPRPSPACERPAWLGGAVVFKHPAEQPGQLVAFAG